jgi:death-on-curing protein
MRAPTGGFFCSLGTFRHQLLAVSGGKMADIIRLSEVEVLEIRRQMGSMQIATQDAFGHIDPVDYNKFSMAVNRQNTSCGGVYKYRAISEVGAALFYGIAMGHAFENGNKRTGLVCLLVLLDKNRQLLIDTNENDLYEMARQVAAHEIEIMGGEQRNAETETAAIVDWIQFRTRQRILGDQVIRFSELKELLEGLGCLFEEPSKNFIKIRCGKHMIRTGYPRANFDVPVSEVKKIRRNLHLDETHGTDSAGFYDLRGQVDKFVNQYRNLMKRLADL